MFSYLPKKVLLASILLLCFMIKVKAQDSLDANMFQQAIHNNPKAILLDVRTSEEYEKSHIKEAKNMDVKNPNFLQNLDSVDHNTPLLVYCLSGTRSKVAAHKLSEKGFNHVTLLNGGLLAWEKDQLPLEEKQNINRDEYTQEDLQKVLVAHSKVLVDFNAIWCGPCLLMAPKIKKIEKEFAGKIHVERINVDNAPKLTQMMKIRSIPMLILFVDGKPVKALEGNQSLKEIRNFVQ